MLLNIYVLIRTLSKFLAVFFYNYVHAGKLLGELREDFKEEIQEQERKMEAAMTKGETQTCLFLRRKSSNMFLI